jgi:hypothetical protein
VVPFQQDEFSGQSNNAFGSIGSFNMLGFPKEMSAPQLQLQEIVSPQDATAALQQAHATKSVWQQGV